MTRDEKLVLAFAVFVFMVASAIVLSGCGGQLMPYDVPAGCLPPTTNVDGFVACHTETLNDGTGPDDHRRVCSRGDDTWILYASGETWHIRSDTPDPVICHIGPDGYAAVSQ